MQEEIKRLIEENKRLQEEINTLSEEKWKYKKEAESHFKTLTYAIAYIQKLEKQNEIDADAMLTVK